MMIHQALLLTNREGFVEQVVNSGSLLSGIPIVQLKQLPNWHHMRAHFQI